MTRVTQEESRRCGVKHQYLLSRVPEIQTCWELRSPSSAGARGGAKSRSSWRRSRRLDGLRPPAGLPQASQHLASLPKVVFVNLLLFSVSQLILASTRLDRLLTGRFFFLLAAI